VDETATTSATKNLAMDYKISRQSSTSSNNLLKPDGNLWSANASDLESLRNQSQSLSNIAGKFLSEFEIS
jgi:hypothetical protein